MAKLTSLNAVWCRRCGETHTPGSHMNGGGVSSRRQAEVSSTRPAMPDPNRPDEDSAPLPCVTRTKSEQSDHPPQFAPLSQIKGESVAFSPTDVKKFNRTAYQREYMRDLPKAKSEGLTVKQWRDLHGK